MADLLSTLACALAGSATGDAEVVVAGVAANAAAEHVPMSHMAMRLFMVFSFQSLNSSRRLECLYNGCQTSVVDVNI